MHTCHTRNRAAAGLLSTQDALARKECQRRRHAPLFAQLLGAITLLALGTGLAVGAERDDRWIAEIGAGVASDLEGYRLAPTDRAYRLSLGWWMTERTAVEAGWVESYGSERFSNTSLPGSGGLVGIDWDTRAWTVGVRHRVPLGTNYHLDLSAGALRWNSVGQLSLCNDQCSVGRNDYSDTEFYGRLAVGRKLTRWIGASLGYEYYRMSPVPEDNHLPGYEPEWDADVGAWVLGVFVEF